MQSTITSILIWGVPRELSLACLHLQIGSILIEGIISIYSITYISNFILFILVWLCQLCCEWIYIYNKCTVSNHGIDYKLNRKKNKIIMLSVFCIIIKRLHTHDDVMTWQHLLHCWRFGWGIHWSQFYLFPSQCGTLVVSLLLAWTRFWTTS